MRTSAVFLLLLLIAAAPARAGLAITEIAANPVLAEPGGEFVVLTNTGSAPVVLDGMRLTDGARAVRGVVGPDVSLDPGQRIALQPPADPYACPTQPHRALLSAWAGLNNAGDTVVLEAPDGAELDRVTYPREAFAAEGPSLRLNPVDGRWSPSAGTATPCALPAPRAGHASFGDAEVVVSERAASAAIEVRRTGGTNGRLTLSWFTRDGSATAESDYRASSGAVSFAAGRQHATIAVPLLDDPTDEADESFTLVLAGGSVIEPARTVVRIADDDAPPPPLVSIPLATHAPPPVPAPASPVPPRPSARATLALAAWQPVLRRGGVVAHAGCTSGCELAVSGRIGLGRGRFAPLAGVRRRLSAGTSAVVLLRLPQRQVRSVRRALRRRGSLPLVVVAEPVGGEPVERRTRIR